MDEGWAAVIWPVSLKKSMGLLENDKKSRRYDLLEKKKLCWVCTRGIWRRTWDVKAFKYPEISHNKRKNQTENLEEQSTAIY